METQKKIEANMEFIPLCIPHIAGNEWKYIKECLDTGWVSSVGKYVELFEQEFAKKINARYAVACSSGTAALHLALLLAGVGQDDEVLVPTFTFAATVNAVCYVQAHPVFMDAEANYFQMDALKVRAFLATNCEKLGEFWVNKKTKRRVKAIIPVHTMGHPVDLDAFIAIAQEYNLKLIEDAAGALGAKYKKKSIGESSEMACFSFNGNKIITTGGGGMFVTSNPELAKRAKHLSTQAKADPIEYIQDEIGYNYRLNNVQAAMGVAQLELLDQFIAKKQKIARIYNAAFENIDGIKIPQKASWADSTDWMYSIMLDPDKFGMDSRQLLKALEEYKIQTRPLWYPIHLSPPFKNSYETYQCDVAVDINKNCLSLPCSVDLTEENQARIIEAILSFKGSR